MTTEPPVGADDMGNIQRLLTADEVAEWLQLPKSRSAVFAHLNRHGPSRGVGGGCRAGRRRGCGRRCRGASGSPPAR